MPEPTRTHPGHVARSAASALRLPPGALPQLHGLLDLADERPANSGAAAPTRQFRRWVYRDRAIHARVEHLGGSVIECEVAPRDLSCAGIGLLHNGFFHAGTVVTLTLHSLDGEPVHVRGTVKWCKHTIRQVHESGVEFSQNIDPRNFLPLDNSADSLIYETISPAELAGALLHVEPNPAERKLVAHMLRQTELRVHGVGTLAEALAAYERTHVDVILTEADLDGGSAIELLSELHARGARTPVIVLTSLSLPALDHAFADAGVAPALLLGKPFDENLVLCAAAQVLLAGAITGAASGPIRSRLISDGAIDDLVREFVAGLHRDADRLGALLTSGNADALRRVVHMLRSSGASYGFEPVSAAAAAVEGALGDANDTVENARGEVNRLIEVLRRCVAS